MEIRTRFAPSPTGYMHIGNLRTALYEYLIAKSKGGKFILRIEDTDQERYVEGAVDIIYNTLRLTGLKHDEGPDIGGDYGPYVQSERMGIYMDYAKELIEKGEGLYEKAMEDGICSEQARLFLPAYGLYVRWYWTASLQSVAHFVKQRMDAHAQKEIRDYAKVVYDLSLEQFPVAMKALIEHAN